MIIVLAGLFAVSILTPLFFSWWGRSTFYLLTGILSAAFLWTFFYLPVVIPADQAAPIGAPNAPPAEVVSWIPQLGVELAFRMDILALVMSMLITGVGAAVMLYCARYFPRGERGAGPFAAQLFAFAAAMLGLVLSDDLVMLFIFWELTTVLSFLLIGYSAHRIFARRSAIQALVVTTFGGLIMLVGLLWLGELAGSYRLSDILASAAELNGTAVDIALALILIGAISKSALVPFHFWLPAAMAAPTPVSAYLHAAAMVKAGIYLVARFAPGFYDTAFWLPLVLGLGLLTMLIGAYRALRQTDIKLILAYGTVSQLGFLMMVNGLGTEDAALAGLAMLLAHGLFKAALFMVVGIIDHNTGTRDLRVLSGIGAAQRPLLIISAVAVASMAGLPPLFGFVAKEVVFESFYGYAEVNGTWGWVVLGGVVLASALTVAYSARFLWGAFAAKRHPAGHPAAGTALPQTQFHHHPDAVFLAAPALLAAATVLFAVAPQPLQQLMEPFAALFEPVDPAVEPTYLALWHGLTPVLGLSALTWALGLGLFWRRGRNGRALHALPEALDAERLYRVSIRHLDDFAAWVTSKTQRGSLGWYLFIIMAVATGVPAGVIAFTGHTIPGHFILAEGPMQVVLNVHNQQADATFITAQPEVKQALEAAMPKLREMMDQAGIQLGQANVQTGMPNHQQGAGSGQQQARSGSPGSFGKEQEGDVALSGTTAASATTSGLGLVDTFA